MPTHAEILDIVAGGRTARDAQRDIGPSEIGGCRRRLWHRMADTPEVNPNMSRLESAMGTAFHHHLEQRVRWLDPFGERYLTEVEVSYAGLRGHVDLYDSLHAEVLDWKTTTLRAMRGFPKPHQVIQVQTYGLLLAGNGIPVEKVTLVAIPRDAPTERIVPVTMAYDEEKARQGLERLQQVRDAFDAGEVPDPEERVSFCRSYCPFFDPSDTVGCPGVS